ncbi:T9SS type A sorting domain-containing protein [Panacibacter ginsenosidivorans]|nr:T9SS type A sorting domain-containing protein [Panacibacter ginsenosidivorans]
MFNYGVWQTFGDPINVVQYPEIKGRLCNFNWKDIEVANNVWAWDSFDIELTRRAQDSLPIIFLVYTEEGAPDWIYDLGVPKVAQNENGTITYAPYYANNRYKNLFKRMITTVHQHIETLPYPVRKFIIGVQGCFGSTGDYIGYKGTVDSQYALTDEQFFGLFTEFSQYYYNEYVNTDPKIYLLSNPQNNGQDQMNWLIQNCPNGWIKCGSIGKGFQLNDEVYKSGWLYNLLNYPQNGDYIRSRSELQFNPDESGWWSEYKYKNMFALITYDIFWGLDWSNQAPGQIFDQQYDYAFNFYNKYAGQKKPSTATNAMCALRDGLNAADTIRFPVSVYGKADRADTTRYKNIATRFAKFGARQEDPLTATLGELNNLAANGINDVGWDVFPGNYERYLHQLKANETSVGYWNVRALADSNTMYGKYARGINATNSKNALYFDVDSLFLNNAPVNGKYPIIVDITYLDSGFGGFRMFYDAKTSTNKSSLAVQLTNTNVWKKASVTLYDAYFGNRAFNASDFYIQAINNQNVLFSVVELSRPDSANPRLGLFTQESLLFDTICTKSTGSIKSFILNGYFLNGSNILISPLPGYSFSTAINGTFTDSLIISSYGTGINKSIYVKFSPLKTNVYSGNVFISGGGYKAISMALKGAGINSRPVLTANISNASCNNTKNGAIDLVVTGGAGPFSYSWTTDSFPFKSTTEDINGLSPANYSVTVNSFGGCTVTAEYIITQPSILSASIKKDSDIVCKGSTTTVTVSAVGGTTPYAGTGIFTVSSGNVSFVVTDANGCASETDKITILPGALVVPPKPDEIKGNDGGGLCDGGTFYYAASPVSSATSYTWTLPAGTVIKKTSAKKDSISLTVQAEFAEGTLLVTANNVCGSSLPASKTITAIPEKPVGISGPVSVFANQAGLIYSVINPKSVLTYTWSSSSGTRITTGQNTWQATINWGPVDGKVNVKANNNCGSSGPASIDVTVLSPALQNTLKTKVKNKSNIKSLSAIVMPNPANTLAIVGFIAEKTDVYEMELTDLTGKTLLRKKLTSIIGANTEKINMQPYSNGLYFITLTNNTGRVTLKVIRN